MSQTPPSLNQCIFGVSAYQWKHDTVVIPTTTIEYNVSAEANADTCLWGSFCPLISGSYKLEFNGTVNSQYCHYFYFINMNEENVLPGIKRNIYLRAGKCYPFSMCSCDLSYTYSTISVQLNDNLPYIPNSTELISCQYDGYLNKLIFKNKCTCATKKKFEIATLITLITKCNTF